jgi:hypothetical protein
VTALSSTADSKQERWRGSNPSRAAATDEEEQIERLALAQGVVRRRMGAKRPVFVAPSRLGGKDSCGGRYCLAMAPRDRLPDGTPVFHPVGELRVDPDDQTVCCGLCGRWVRALGGHLGPAHDWSADDYRLAFGLNAKRPLQAPAVSHAQATTLKRRIQTDSRIQAGMRLGAALARSGQLNQLGRQTDAQRGRGSSATAEPFSRALTSPDSALLATAPSATAVRKRSATQMSRTWCASATSWETRRWPSWRAHWAARRSP